MTDGRLNERTSLPDSVYVTSWLPVSTKRSVGVAVKLTTPPDGLTSALVGSDGTLEEGPRIAVGSGASQMGLISAAVGPATLPPICGVGDPAWAAPRDPQRTATRTITPTRARPVLLRWDNTGRRSDALITISHRPDDGFL